MPQDRRVVPLYPYAKSAASFEDGAEFLDYACQQLLIHRALLIVPWTSKRRQIEDGESMQGVEFKLDNLCTETGRLSIETYEKTRDLSAPWTPSGILRNDRTWLYVQGNRELLFVFAVKFLVNYYAAVGYRSEREARPTLRGFYLPLGEAWKHAAMVIDNRMPTHQPTQEDLPF